MSTDSRALLDEQQAYYRERAPEYDEYWQRRGRFDEGAEQNRRWFAEAGEVKAALAAFDAKDDVLELAAGTGWWTPELLKRATRLTVLDGSPEALAVNRARIGPHPRVNWVVDDIFSWTADRAYDVVFFGFWLSHVPPALFDGFWSRVRSFLKPGGRAFFVDSKQPSTAAARARPHTGDVTVRRLNDGREFRVVKLFYDPDELGRRLEALGWTADVHATDIYFVYGTAVAR